MYPASLSFTTMLRTTRHAFLLDRALVPIKAVQARDAAYVIDQSDARYHVQLAANPQFSPTLGRRDLTSEWSAFQTFTRESRFDSRHLLLAVLLLLLI